MPGNPLFLKRVPLRWIRGSSPRMTSLLHKRRELRALIRHEHRDQFRRLGIAGIGRDQMRSSWRLEERLTNLEGLDRTAGQLRADLALADIGGGGAPAPVPPGHPPRAPEHPQHLPPLPPPIRQPPTPTQPPHYPPPPPS